MIHARRMLQDFRKAFLHFPKIEQHPKCMDHAILHGKPFSNPLLLHVYISDIDECSAEYSTKCDTNADCNNTQGSYTCKCREGYFGDGEICSGKQFKLISFYHFQQTIKSCLFKKKTLRVIKTNTRKSPL